MSSDHFAKVRHHFNDLASEDEEVRLAASSAILSGLDAASATDVEKALERLVKGLASGRKSARIGYSITLTELLSRLWARDRRGIEKWHIELAHILQSLQKHTVPRGKVTGQEERDNSFGRLFGLEAILKARILSQDGVSQIERQQFVDLIMKLAREKSWLREECGWIIYSSLQADQPGHDASNLAKTIIDGLGQNKLVLTPEGVAIWLSVRSLYPTLTLPKAPWSHQDPLHSENVTQLAAVLKEAPMQKTGSEGENESVQRGMWNSKPHFAWDLILTTLFQDSQLEADGNGPQRITFEMFWSHAVNDGLFSASASKERKYWGMMLFAKVFEEGPERSLPTIFLENVIRCLVNHLSDEDRYLHRTAQRVLKLMFVTAEKDPSRAYEAIVGLTRNGAHDFDQATKTKTISRLLCATDGKGLKKFVSVIDGAIRTPGDLDTKSAEARRQTFANLLVSALRAGSLTKDPTDWVQRLLNTFAKYAYLDTSKAALALQPPFSAASKSMFRTRLSSCFAHLLSSHEDVTHERPFKVLCYLRKKSPEHSKASMSEQINQDVSTAMDKLDRLHEMDKSKKEKYKAHVRAFMLLYAFVIFQVYDGDTDGPMVLSELDECYDKILGNLERSADASSEILVEVLLSFASKRSALLRKLTQQVFAAFVGDIKAGGLQLLFNVLETKESLTGQQSLFDNVDDEADVDEAMPDAKGDSDGASEDNDVEEVSATASDESSNADNSDAASANDEEELTRFNATLAKIVGTRPFSEKPTNDSAESSESEAMNDDEMFALDSQLTTVFAERRKVANGTKKRETKDAKENIINFKNRVLDLLDIFIKKQHTHRLVLDLILPLLVLIRTTTSKQIADRACGYVRELNQRCKGKELPVLKKDKHAWKLLDAVHEEALVHGSKAHAAACSQGSLLVAKCLMKLDEDSVERVVQRYGQTQVAWLKGKKVLQPRLFADFLGWCTSHSKTHR